ncbi:meiotically up-regulated gene family-domain-containing protein [Mycena amicta]|nr:meiotically up-regulated gene family-domain-containing protein [Mycena amicta]
MHEHSSRYPPFQRQMAFRTLFHVAAGFGLVAGAQVAYYDPSLTGGSMLTFQNEPLNIIVSALSSPEALTDRGLVNYGNALGYADDCLGIHLGGPQAANLGDGNNWVNQTQMMREDYGLPIGTCLETLIGGNHYRVFRQNGTAANSGALFLAASKEDPITEQHNIVPNGYNIGRDQVVAAATSGVVSFNGVDYTTTVEYVTGLLPPGANGINHNISVDGVTAVLTVTASVVDSGINCKGSSLCGSLSAASCDAARDKIVDSTIYRTDGAASLTGVCSGHCGFFVQGTGCRYDGSTMLEAYAELRADSCQKCGSKRYLDGCEITVNYVSSC